MEPFLSGPGGKPKFGNFTGKGLYIGGKGLREYKRSGGGVAQGTDKIGKKEKILIFSLLPLPPIEKADLQPWCGEGVVSIRKTDLQFCPLSVWVLSFNSPISINPHLAAHPSSDISSFPFL